MAQVIDTKGDKRDASRNGTVRGSSHGGNKLSVTPEKLEPEVVSEELEPREFTSRPFSRQSYGGLSGGTPVSNRNQLSQSSWSPTYASLTKGNGRGVDEMKDRFGSTIKSILPHSEMYDAIVDSGALPDPDSWGSPRDEQNELNAKYEKMFKSDGMSDDDIETIRSRGNFLDVAARNPATRAATDMTSNPWSNTSISDLQVPDYDSDDNSLLSVVPDTLRSFSESMFDENGNYKSPNTPERYKKTKTTTTGDLTAIDDGTMDYDHLTADRVRGDRMQEYVEQGMGGRSWWDYSPYMVYLKSDEAQNHGFKPYLPDDMSKANMGVTSYLDTPSDLAGTLSDARTSSLPSYEIRYDVDNNPETTDDIVTLNGRDFNTKDTAYYHNISKLAAENPNIFLKRPKNDEIHGAPVTTTILENAVKDINGDTKYAYGNIENIDYGDDYTSFMIPLTDGSSVSVPLDELGINEKGNPTTIPEWLPYDDIDWNRDWEISPDFTYYKIRYSDGSEIDVPKEEYDSWYDDQGESTDSFPGTYVSLDNASGTLPDDIDSLNSFYRENYFDPERDTWQSYPVRYTPDLVMSDGTRVTYPQFLEIYGDDKRSDKKSGDFAGTNVAYDYNMLNKPSVLMKNGGQLFNEDMSLNWGDLLPGAIDMTLGSLPISVDKFAWPLSVTQALSKSMSGLEANGYDPLTDSDMYISGQIDKDTGEFTPTANDVSRIAAMTGNALIPLTENIAGNVSGRSFIPALSGDIPMNSTLRQLGKAWFLGNLGEGIEEIPGNVFDEATMYADRAYGMPIDPETGEPLMERGDPLLGFLPGPLVPVTDENGDYKFVDEYTGEPITEMRDSMNHVYKDPNTSALDRFANFYTNYADLANALSGGFSVGGVMSLPNVLAVPQAIRNSNYRRATGLPQYIEPEEIDRKTISLDEVNKYLESREQ